MDNLLLKQTFKTFHKLLCEELEEMTKQSTWPQAPHIAAYNNEQNVIYDTYV